jgi:protein-disulfide isomerase
MDLQSLESVVRELNAAAVRYLIAGGLAVAAHGYLRFTADVDLVIQLDPDNIVNAFDALARLDYRPTVPVTVQQFSDPSQRQRWVDERGMQVLNLFSDRNRTTPVDVFVTEPFDFQCEYDNSMVAEIAPGLPVRFVSIATLIRMKQVAGRAKDLDDIEHLRMILDDGEHP